MATYSATFMSCASRDAEVLKQFGETALVPENLPGEKIQDKSECAFLSSAGLRLFLSNRCDYVRTVKLEWSFSNSSEKKVVSYRIGHYPIQGKREIKFIGSAARIISDVKTEASGTLEAEAWVKLEVEQNPPTNVILFLRNTHHKYIFVVERSGRENQLDKEIPHTWVLPPKGTVPGFSGRVVIDSPLRPHGFRLEAAEFEPE